MKIKLNDDTYKFLKWTCLIAIPAASIFYAAIAKIWNIGYAAEVAATLDAVSVFIGSVIGISTKNYYAEDSSEE